MTPDDTDHSSRSPPTPDSQTHTSSSGDASSLLLGDVSLQRGGSRFSLARVRGLWLKVTPKKFETPTQIASEIRRLRGHAKSTVYQRHKKFSDGDESCPYFEDLVPLCMRLIALSGKDAVTEKLNPSLKEIFRLYAQDPVVYHIFQHCIRENTAKSPEGGYFITPHSKPAELCHRRWSKLLGSCSFESIDRSETKQSNCNALKDSLGITQYLLMAIEFIPYAMTLKVQNEDLELLRQLWDHFLSFVPVSRWMNNVDLCFENIVKSGKPLAYFASPLQLGRIARYLVKKYASTTKGDGIDFILTTFFSKSWSENHDPKNSPYGAKFYCASSSLKLDIVTASKYAMFFLFAGSDKHVERFKRKELPTTAHTGSLTETDTFFRYGTNAHLYKIVNNASMCYLCAAGVLGNGKLEESIHRALVAVVEPHLGSIAEQNSLGNKDYWSLSSSNFDVAHTVDIDRYHKHEMIWFFFENDAFVDVINDRLRFHAYLERPDGICKLTSIPQFQNVSYLRRFRRGSTIFIAADSLPEAIQDTLSEDTTIDTMLLDGKTLTCLRVDNESPVFGCDGHYPILAGVDPETADPLYVAVVRQEVDSPWYFTTAKDGASAVEYTNEVGEKVKTRSFFVLALRHDPIDLPPQDSRHRVGAKDPTGPVYWMEFWPRKDAHYFYDDRLRDDQLLESLLKDLRERKITESILEGFN
ncbi:hypothetical protein SCHPADRAFT_938063 [Schizopora paradoxa]|uniref:Uncharacterized protein n=1 Tax=Schizopora paradoxa TaxID=27342 RepID=A0A0H2RWS7_9AGAM|nr:hypothetical protein SCHPADRAFT_938063 [Schizopora paradoxa]